MDNKLILPCDVSQVSDGYHTFEELYTHRCLLFMNLVARIPKMAFKTWLNDKGEAWEGWFILGLNTPNGQITYHLPAEYWDLVEVPEIFSNADYDEHTSADVIERLKMLVAR